MAIAVHRHLPGFWSMPYAGGAVASRAEPPLRRGEHPLLRAPGTDGLSIYVATERAMYHRATHQEPWQRLAWVDVSAVERAPATGEVVLRGWPGSPARPARLRVAPGSRLPNLVRERIAACQVLVRQVRLAGGASVLVTALREDGSSEVRWSARVWHAGNGAAVPAAAIDRLLQEFRAQAGC